MLAAPRNGLSFLLFRGDGLESEKVVRALVGVGAAVSNGDRDGYWPGLGECADTPVLETLTGSAALNSISQLAKTATRQKNRLTYGPE